MVRNSVMLLPFLLPSPLPLFLPLPLALTLISLSPYNADSYSGHDLHYTHFVHCLSILERVVLYSDGRGLFPLHIPGREGEGGRERGIGGGWREGGEFGV